jgi:hypothetical protein
LSAADLKLSFPDAFFCGTNAAVDMKYACILGYVKVKLASRKVASSTPDEVNAFFSVLPNPSGRTRPWGLLSL